MNVFKATLDTRHQNGVIGTVTQFDNATLELQVVTDGVINEAWDNPQFELIAMKRDANQVREVDQDRFTILSKEDHKVQIELKEQFLTCRGTVKMQLVVKDGSRLSTTLFRLIIGQSLDHDVIESHRDVAVLDELEAYVKQGFDDLAYQEQRMVAVEQSTNDLNETMNANEEERNAAEAKRSKTFETNEANRTQTFNNQIEEQSIAFSNAQSQRDESFSESEQNMSQAFETSQRERESAFNKAQELNQTTFTNNETKRQTAFNQSQTANQQDFVDNEAERQRLFETNEASRQKSESQRVKNESERVFAETKRADAEVIRQQKMTEFEEKATQLSEDLDSQVARVDEFVSENEEKLLGPYDKTDYMGNAHKSVKDANDANVEYILGEVNTVHYEGQHITATDTIEKQVRSAILSGQTLVNLAPKYEGAKTTFFSVDGSGFTQEFNEDYYTITANGSNCNIALRLYTNEKWQTSQSLKLNTKYLAIVDLDVQVSKNISLYCGKLSYSGIYGKTSISNNGRQRLALEFTTPSEIDSTINIGTDLYSDSGDYISVYSIMLIEYQDGMENWEIPYFEGIQSVKLPVLTTTGKNLFDNVLSNRENVEVIVNNIGDNEYSIQTENTNLWDSQNIYKKIPIKKGETIHWYGYFKNMANIRMYLNGFDTLVANHQPTTISTDYEFFDLKYTATSDGFVLCRFWLNGVNSIGYLKDIMFELNSKTTYEPFKSNILSTPSDLELRSNGSVCDELDLITGQLTQRIDENGDVLAQEVVKTVDLSGQKVYSYDGTTHYSCSAAEGALIPTLSIDVPTNLPALVSRQRATIESQKEQIITLEQENEQLIAQNEVQDIDISLNQDAINFMLFAPATMSLNDKSRNNEGVNTMAAYLANQILKGKLDYTLVVSRYGSYKEDIDTILIAEGKQDLIK